MERLEIMGHLEALGDMMGHIGRSQSYRNKKFSQLTVRGIEMCIPTAIHHNGWFSEENVRSAFREISSWLLKECLISFTEQKPFYRFEKRVSLILAGNLPLVGFHDVLCGLLMGCKLQIKMSSDDNRLLPVLVNALKELNPLYAYYFELDPPKLSNFDAVIGTGSDSALLHFKDFFKDVPHLLRGNRTSVAVLKGNESKEDLRYLGKDIFQYYGRGCRSVTHLIVPKGYSMNSFFEALVPYSEVLQNKKYGNNYEYHRAIFMLSQQPFLDNNFLLLKETTDLQPPLAMVYYHQVAEPSEVETYLQNHQHQVQCIVGHGFLPFGTSQQPRIDDFADNINTLDWLSKALN